MAQVRHVDCKQSVGDYEMVASEYKRTASQLQGNTSG